MIPVVDIAGQYSFASQHPFLAGLAIAALAAVALLTIWALRRFPEHGKKMRVGMFVALAALAVGVNWQMFKPQPSFIEQVQEAAHRYQQNADG